jgi:hypothetical protein
VPNTRGPEAGGGEGEVVKWYWEVRSCLALLHLCGAPRHARKAFTHIKNVEGMAWRSRTTTSFIKHLPADVRGVVKHHLVHVVKVQVD